MLEAARGRIHRALSSSPASLSAADRKLSVVRYALVALILLSVGLAIVESEESVALSYAAPLAVLEGLIGAVFAVEYTLRIWTCVEDPRFSQPVLGRIRYALTPAALFDLVAITPVFFPAIGDEAFLLRLVRLVRILRLAKLGRYSAAVSDIATAIKLKRHQLLVSVLGGAILLLVSATFLFVVEGEAQPEAFGSIPRAMWWSMATLTTVGYGDVYPMTFLGRVFASITAVIGIGLIALPAGIVAAAFSEVMTQRREALAEKAGAAATSTAAFAGLVAEIVSRAEGQGRPHVEINAGELHRMAGDFPDPAGNGLLQCCAALRAMRQPADEIVFSPPGDDDASLTIRYALPRRAPLR